MYACCNQCQINQLNVKIIYTVNVNYVVLESSAKPSFWAPLAWFDRISKNQTSNTYNEGIHAAITHMRVCDRHTSKV